MTDEEHRGDDGSSDGLDPSIDWETQDRRAIAVGKQMLAQVAGAGLGLLVGGPFGATVGAVAGAGVVPLLDLMAQGQHRAIRRVDHFAQGVTQLTDMTPDDLAAWARASEQREALLLAAIHCALNGTTQKKLTALARIVAENVADERNIYVSSLVVRALVDMEEPHILALRALVLEDLPVDPAWNLAQDAYAQAQLEQRFPGFADGVPQILSALAAHGIVREGLPITATNSAGVVTKFGKRCLSYLIDYPMPPSSS